MIWKAIERYLPIRIHHIYFAYGWWWGEKFYFFSRKYGLEMMSMAKESKDAIYARNGNCIGNGDTCSWSKDRQRENFKLF